MPNDSNLLTTDEVASRLRTSVWTVRRMLRDGRLTGFRLDGKWLVPRHAVFAFLDGKRNVPSPYGPRFETKGATKDTHPSERKDTRPAERKDAPPPSERKDTHPAERKTNE